jgi:hypothetical protein
VQARLAKARQSLKIKHSDEGIFFKAEQPSIYSVLSVALILSEQFDRDFLKMQSFGGLAYDFFMNFL